MFRERDHNLRISRILQRSIGLHKQFTVIFFALRADDDAPLILRIEFCDLRLKQTRLRAKPRMPDLDLDSAQRFFLDLQAAHRGNGRVLSLRRFRRVRTRGTRA